MKLNDLLMMSLSNLWRRKLRTFLTVLGVIIGTASVVIMLSLGIGLKNMTAEMYSQFGSMTAVDVYSAGRYRGTSSSENDYLTDDLIATLESLDHVKYASPKLRVDVILKQGLYETQTSLYGVDQNYMSEVDIGSGHTPKSGELEIVMGNLVKNWFSNSKTGKGFYDYTKK